MQDSIPSVPSERSGLVNRGYKQEKEIQMKVIEQIHDPPVKEMEKCKEVTLEFENVHIWANAKEHGKKYKKLINKDLSGIFKAGTSTAILGPSGSGKTTLLNYLSARMRKSSLKFNGKLKLNGREITSVKEFKHLFAYVQQDDVMFEEFSPREQFVYTARFCGLPNPKKSAEDLIDLLNLSRCADTKVGGATARGISGGERKRTSIGIELITDPSFIFMDEPTTGLDSKSALDIANIIRLLTSKGRTVVSTIHQPSKEILERFDKIICLCEGFIIYNGKPVFVEDFHHLDDENFSSKLNKKDYDSKFDIVSYFSAIGFAPAEHTNPADHIMNIVNDDDIRIASLTEGREITEDEVQVEFSNRLETLVKYYKGNNEKIDEIPPMSEPEWKNLKEDNRNISVIRNWFILLSRSLSYFFRNPAVLPAKFVQIVMFAGFSMLLFHKIEDPENNTSQAIQDRIGLVFSVVGTLGFGGVFASLFGIIPQLGPFYRDLEKRLYGASPFYLIVSMFHQPFQLILNMCYLLMMWWVVEFDRSWETFFKYYLILYVEYFAASGFGDILSVALRDIGLVNQAFPLFVVPMFVVSGFLGVIKDAVFYLYWFSFVSFFRFGFQAGIYIEFDEETERRYKEVCTIIKPNCVENCVVKSPNAPQCDPFRTLDFNEEGFWRNTIILAALGVGYRIIALLVINYVMMDRQMKNSPLPNREEFEVPTKEGAKGKKIVFVDLDDDQKEKFRIKNFEDNKNIVESEIAVDKNFKEEEKINSNEIKVLEIDNANLNKNEIENKDLDGKK